MANKVKITFVLPAKLQDEMRQKIIADGYGLRGKSRWVSHALQSLLAIDNYHELVNYNDGMLSLEKVETVVLPLEQRKALEEAILHVRQFYPMLEGVQSRILRTCILQKLIRS